MVVADPVLIQSKLQSVVVDLLNDVVLITELAVRNIFLLTSFTIALSRRRDLDLAILSGGLLFSHAFIAILLITPGSFLEKGLVLHFLAVLINVLSSLLAFNFLLLAFELFFPLISLLGEGNTIPK